MGIQSDVNEQLTREAKVTSLEEWQKYVVVLFDEVKIKEDLVYNRGVYIRWNGMVEWNSGMDYWNGGMLHRTYLIIQHVLYSEQ